MNRNTHSQQEILRAVYEGRPEDVHGSVLNALSDRGLVAHDLDYGWHVTEQGMLEIPDRDVAPIEDAPKPLEYPARATKALAQRMVDEGLKAEAIVERVVIQPAPSIAIPIPSESERNMRRAAYASIRDGLHRALSAGQALVPILDSLEETDPLLNGGAG